MLDAEGYFVSITDGAWNAIGLLLIVEGHKLLIGTSQKHKHHQ